MIVVLSFTMDSTTDSIVAMETSLYKNNRAFYRNTPSIGQKTIDGLRRLGAFFTDMLGLTPCTNTLGEARVAP